MKRLLRQDYRGCSYLPLGRFSCPSPRFRLHSRRGQLTVSSVHDGIRQSQRCILTHGLPLERTRRSCAVAGLGSDRQTLNHRGGDPPTQGLFCVGCHRAKNLSRLLARLAAKATMYNCGQRINDCLGRPLRYLADLLV